MSRRACFSSSRRDAIAPLGVLEHDEVLRQPRAIFVEAPHLDGSTGAAAGGQEPMAVRQRPRFDFLHHLRIAPRRSGRS